MKKMLLSICIVFSITGAGQWKLSGLDTITVFGIAQHKGNIYAGTKGAGIYMSADKGRSWMAVNIGLSNLFVRSLLSKGSLLYAGTKNGVCLSTDNGATWIPKNTGMAEGVTIFSLLSADGYLYGGTAKGVYRSADDGASWKLEEQGFNGEPYVYALTSLSPDIFAGTQENGVMRSSDGGISWTRSGSGIPQGMTISSFNAINTNSFICGTDGAGCFLSTDKGANWQAITNGITHDRFFGLTADNKNIYAGALNIVFRSMDNGKAWSALPVQGLPANTSINSILAYNKIVFIGTDTGIYSYNDE